MNRVTHLFHQERFLKRHTRILAYSHKYVISDKDVVKHQEAGTKPFMGQKSKAEMKQIIEDLVGDFDPQNNKTDRQIYYEVTGKQLIEGEFDELNLTVE